MPGQLGSTCCLLGGPAAAAAAAATVGVEAAMWPAATAADACFSTAAAATACLGALLLLPLRRLKLPEHTSGRMLPGAEIYPSSSPRMLQQSIWCAAACRAGSSWQHWGFPWRCRCCF
jgi:hypothetical protein